MSLRNIWTDLIWEPGLGFYSLVLSKIKSLLMNCPVITPFLFNTALISSLCSAPPSSSLWQSTSIWSGGWRAQAQTLPSFPLEQRQAQVLSYMNKALQWPPSIANASFPIFTAGSSCHGFKLSGAVPVLPLLNTSAPASWNKAKEGIWWLRLRITFSLFWSTETIRPMKQ